MKLLTIIGARPQFVKAAAVSRALRAQAGIEEKLVHTGQHFDANMSDIFFEEMDIPVPDYHLDINSLSHGAMTGRMLERIEEVLQAERPGGVLVYGDTNSTLAGALAAKKMHIPVFHVEAGLRSFNMEMPEEINRILTDRISDVLFCPTQTAVDNLAREGFAHFDNEIVLCGDVMEDAAMYYAGRAAEKSTILKQSGMQNRSYYLCTLHRQENTDVPERLGAIVGALNALHRDMPVLLPLHPRTRKMLDLHGIRLEVDILPPLGYFDMLHVLQNASIVLTDSGGLQKEAYFFNKYCVTLRDQTEWTELVDNGYNRLAGADGERILSAVHFFAGKVFHKGASLYGGGRAAERIAKHLAGF
ncbi:MAG: UDP-N-acetylglucosamine 2-epimerase (non-hydrolyzing) [Saprospiraceae bacterium]|nr:UDP-N-acetylglucosamine 2-epimerase (non-hydrolyzing) [Saprospiraceae bacterium]